MKKAFKISAVLMALVVLAALAVAFTSGAAPTEIGAEDFRTAIENGGDFKLKEDIGGDVILEVVRVGENVTLDLAGHTITSAYANGGLFYQLGVANPGTFVIKDSVGGGAIIAPAASLLDNVAGTVRIEGGTIVTKNLKTDKTTANVTIKGSGKKGDGAINGTWTSFDPSEYLVYGYTKIDETSPKNDAAIYRVIPKVYTITYEIPATATHTNPDHYDIETEDIVLTDASAPGYNFVGWYIKEGDAEQKISTITTSTHLYDLVIVGKFEAIDYKINYVLDDTMTNNPANPTTFNVTMSDIRLAEPTKDGATFDGWYDAEGNKVETIACNTTLNDVTLYPHFTLIDYTITYVNNGGTVVGGTNPTTYTIDDEVVFISAAKPGYSSLGWFDAANNGNHVEKIEKGTTGNIVLYAGYVTITYNIKYNTGDVAKEDVTNYASFPTTYDVETATFALPVPETAPGMTFIGWEDEQGNMVSVISVGTYGDITLTAKWQKTQYKLFYYFGVGVNSSVVNNNLNKVEYFTRDDEVVLYAPTRAYYDFAGWFYSDPETDNAAVELDKNDEGNWIIPEGTTRNLTVYAKWTPTEYAINYDEHGYQWQPLKDENGNYILDENGDIQYAVDENGEKIKEELPETAVLPKDAPKTYNYVEDTVLPVPTRTGYSFVGWYDVTTEQMLTPNADGKYVIEAGTRNGEITLVAEWKVGKYDVTIQYQYNDDYYYVNKAAIDATPTGRIFYEEKYSVVFGTSLTHVVEFTKYNGFVPENWTVTIESMEAEPKTIIVYFEPVVLSTVYEGGKLIVTYFDESQKVVDINSLASVKYSNNALIYVTADGEETTVASIPTTADIATIEKAVEDVNAALTTLNTKVSGLEASTTESLNKLKADVAANLSKIEQNANSITELKNTVSELQSQVDALGDKDGTLLIVAIIAMVVAVAAAAGVIVLFVKKK